MKTTITNNKRCVIYCRVSTKEQVDEGGSLATQEKICKEYALKNDYDIIVIYVEKGESAKNADRTELKKLLAFCTTKKNAIDTVITYKIDRLARNTDDYRQIRFLLKRHNVEIRSTSEFFEDNPAGRFLENILSNVAQFDNDVRTERSVNGMRDALRAGRFVWGAPTGYDNGVLNGKSNIIPNKTAPLVLRAFQVVAQDAIPVLEAHRRLTKDGLMTKYGKALSLSHFYKLLSNELYAGWINGLGERNKGCFEPIVTEELFHQVQAVLYKKTARTIQYKRDCIDFPLRRFFIHPSGKRLTGCWCKGRNRSYAYYRFHLKGMSYRKEDLEEIFKTFLERYSLSRQQFEQLQAEMLLGLKAYSKNAHKDIEHAQKTTTDLKEKRNILIQKNVDGIISDDILKEQLALIQTDLSKASLELSQPNEFSTVNVEKALKVVRDYFEKPSKTWEKAPLAIKLKLQWFNFPQGIEFDGKDCQTKETSIVYKARGEIQPSIYYRVTPRTSSSNPAPSISLTTIDIIKQLLQLASILQSDWEL